MRARTIAMVAAAALALVGGCGGAEQAPTVTATTDGQVGATTAPLEGGGAATEQPVSAGEGCGAISTDDLEDITGLDLGEGEAQAEGCIWNAGGEGVESVTYTLSTLDPEGWPMAIETIEGIYGDSEEVDVGDDARFFSAGVVGQLAALRGNQMLVVTIGGMDLDMDVVKQQTIEIAERLW